MRHKSAVRSSKLWALALVLTAMVSGLSEAAESEVSRPFQRTLYLVRHGAYDTQDKADHETGKALTQLGVAQARLIAARLRSLPVHFDSITSSTLTRARETAAVIRDTLPELPSGNSPLLSECTPPTLRTSAKSADMLTPSSQQCEQQLNQAFREFLAPAQSSEKKELLICHGNVIRYFVVKALGVDARYWNRMSVAHASLTIIVVRPDGTMRVHAVGDIGHLPASLQSWGAASDPDLVVPR